MSSALLFGVSRGLAGIASTCYMLHSAFNEIKCKIFLCCNFYPNIIGLRCMTVNLDIKYLFISHIEKMQHLTKKLSYEIQNIRTLRVQYQYVLNVQPTENVHRL